MKVLGNHWWRDWRKALDANTDLDAYLYWKVKGRRVPYIAGWTEAERVTAETTAWLYEIDARMRGGYLFGAPLPKTRGLVREVMIAAREYFREFEDLLAYDEGAAGPVYIENLLTADTRAAPPMIFTDARTGIKSKVKVQLNLGASDRALWGAWERDAPRIGLSISRRRFLAGIARLRAERGIPRPRKTAGAGDRRRPVPWRWVELLDYYNDPKRTTKLTNAQLNAVARARRRWSALMCAPCYQKTAGDYWLQLRNLPGVVH